MLGIPKLDDAHKAGGQHSSKCTLILTEGDSAKALAVAGLEVVGRETFGVFPLKGKILNVRHATNTQLKDNQELKHVMAILGLDMKKSYRTQTERNSLRYGKVMIMADQDNDGSHIKGLIINIFRHFWPALLLPPEDVEEDSGEVSSCFLSAFVTPLLKARRGKNETKSFYSEADFNAWKESVGSEFSKWTIKYYKGLGTSTTAEAKEYFRDFDKHVRDFQWDSEADNSSIDMAFDQKRAEERKHWIETVYDETSSIYSDEMANKSSVTFKDFVNKELIHFSHGDNIRSLPSAIDGLKPSQRKILYACFKRKLKSEAKVAQLSGYCAEQTAYHHGEAALQSSIINMAQNFVGSNNMNLLVPNGQFGTRLLGGDDAASPRYIFTQLAPVARVLFPEADDQLLSYREDDGQIVEPEFYCPIIPMLLVNGTKGIGTGWSTSVPSFNPTDLVEYIRAKLDDLEERPVIHPFTRGFTGEIKKWKKGEYRSFGSATAVSSDKVLIEELPVGCWTNAYKEKLNKMIEKKLVTRFTENHTTSKVSFTVTIPSNTLESMEKKSFEKKSKLSSEGLRKLKLVSTIGTSNMNAFDAKGKIKKFETPEDIIEEFFPTRLSLYEDRKSVLQSETEYQALLLRNKSRFIQMVASNEINLQTSKQSIFARLGEVGIDSSSTLDQVRTNNAIGNREQSIRSDTDEKSFDYLLNMPLSSLTSERVVDLEEEAKKRDQQLQEIRGTTAHELWRQDLEKLEPLLPE